MDQFDFNHPEVLQCLQFMYPALKQSVEDNRSAWFRDTGTPPGNIVITWRTSIDTAQVLLNEIERSLKAREVE